MSMRIPFNKPYIIGTELGYIAQCLAAAKLSALRCSDGSIRAATLSRASSHRSHVDHAQTAVRKSAEQVAL